MGVKAANTRHACNRREGMAQFVQPISIFRPSPRIRSMDHWIGAANRRRLQFVRDDRARTAIHPHQLLTNAYVYMHVSTCRVILYSTCMRLIHVGKKNRTSKWRRKRSCRPTDRRPPVALRLYLSSSHHRPSVSMSTQARKEATAVPPPRSSWSPPGSPRRTNTSPSDPSP
jgi:hypothetical protein